MRKSAEQIEIERLSKVLNECQKDIEYYKRKITYLTKQLCVTKDRLDGQLLGAGRFT